ncbi:MAG: HD domain-containing protein [Clostridium sp.]|nr:HD domain-containing protein [Clostridium sp.]MCM1444573.1 HD domain-containing protein [Candidatus Amulumruptor caecigallinarius]
MDIKNINEQKEIFKNYTDKYVNENDEAKINGYIDKQNHSLFVLDEALLTDALFTNYNSSFKNLLVLESLFHDIGRFEQLKVTGSFKVNELKNFYPNMEDHGDLGSIVIKDDGLLKELIPDIRIYDEEVMRVIKAHSKVNPDLLNGIVKDYIETFRNYDLSEIFASNKTDKEKNVLYSTNTAIIQDVDRLDIFRKIVKGIWVPDTTDDKIDEEIFELYNQGKMPTMAEIKEKGLWNANVGHLVRLSFIDQMNLVPVLLKVRQENLIDKVFETTGNNDIVAPAYEEAKKKLDQAINSSDDGILVRKTR